MNDPEYSRLKSVKSTILPEVVYDMTEGLPHNPDLSVLRPVRTKIIHGDPGDQNDSNLDLDRPSEDGKSKR